MSARSVGRPFVEDLGVAQYRGMCFIFGRQESTRLAYVGRLSRKHSVVFEAPAWRQASSLLLEQGQLGGKSQPAACLPLSNQLSSLCGYSGIAVHGPETGRNILFLEEASCVKGNKDKWLAQPRDS